MSPIFNRVMTTQYGINTNRTLAIDPDYSSLDRFLEFVSKTMRTTTAQRNESFVPRVFEDFHQYFDLSQLDTLIQHVNQKIGIKGITVDQTVVERLSGTMIGVDLTRGGPRFYSLIDQNKFSPRMCDNELRSKAIDTALFTILPKVLTNLVFDYEKEQQFAFDFTNEKLIISAFSRNNVSLKRDIIKAAIDQRKKFELNNLFHFYRKKSMVVNLSKVNLSGLDLSALDISFANFDQSDLSGVDFTNSILKSVRLTNSNCSSAKFISSDLSKANLAGSNFTDASFYDADMSGGRAVGAVFYRACLDDADCSHVHFTDANLSLASFANTVLKSAVLNNANLNCAVLKNANLRGSKFICADLSWIAISSIDFRAVTLKNVMLGSPSINGSPFYPVKYVDSSRGNMIRESLALVQLTEAASIVSEYDNDQRQIAISPENEAFLINALTGYDNRLKKRIIRDAFYQGNKTYLSSLFTTIRTLSGGLDLSLLDLSNLDLTGLNLTGANLQGVNLTNSKLTGMKLLHVNLTKATLTQADFSCADLTGSDITNVLATDVRFCAAILKEANFSNSNLRGVDFTGAYFMRTHISTIGTHRTDLTGLITRDESLKRYLRKFKSFFFSEIIVSGKVFLSSVDSAAPSKSGW